MTKREAVNDNTTCKPRKRFAFSAPKNAATKSIIAKNASSSPLLRLPLEIRNHIWRYVLGEQLLHIEYECPYDYVDSETGEKMNFDRSVPRGLWSHHVCQNDGPENREEEKRFTASGGTYFVRPHDVCDRRPIQDPDPDFGFLYEEAEPLSLTVLRSCRQVYCEANDMLLTTNTFAFADPTSFKQFLSTRTPYQKRLIRRLRFYMNWCMLEPSAWNSALTMPTIRSLSGLRHLRLQIHHKMDSNVWRFLKGNNILYSTTFCTGLQKLSTLPLKEVDIAVRTPSYLERMLCIWTKADSEEYSDGLRNLLLDPNGAEIHAEEQRELKEMSRKDREYDKNVRESMYSPVIKSP